MTAETQGLVVALGCAALGVPILGVGVHGLHAGLTLPPPPAVVDEAPVAARSPQRALAHAAPSPRPPPPPARSAPPPPAPVPPPAPEPPRMELRFASGSARPLDPDRGEWDAFVAIVAQETGPIVVEGHTDPNGAEGMNLRLSHLRARAAAALLARAGVARSRMLIRGLGEYAPASASHTANRRAVLRLEPAPEGGATR
jgi:outer membrane protein OmpA-like peptidoglycan-associated protein